jgi:parallel beta-helix repeat protein
MRNKLIIVGLCALLILILIPQGITIEQYPEKNALNNVSLKPGSHSKNPIIYNPYETIDFKTINHYKTNLHTHTTRSDGSSTTQDVISHYHQVGNYDILSITDHNTNTWPWSKWITDQPSFESDAAAYYPSLDMLAISGNELSIGHHRGSLLNDYSKGGALIHKTFKYILNKNGLSFFYHPGRYSNHIDWYQDYFNSYPDTIIGIEIYNQGDQYPHDHLLWDTINKQRPPDDLIWGFSNDDMHHITDHSFRNYQHLLMDDLTELNFKTALEHGAFYCSYEPNGANQMSSNYGQALTPRLIDVTIIKDRISIEGNEVDRVEWYDDNTQIIETSTTLNVSKINSNFVRAVLINDYGITYTQPFGIKRYDIDSLPSSFSWRDIDGIDFTTPIRDQSPFPSCETFAITAAIETMVQYQVGFPFNCDLSEAHLYFYSGGNLDWGSYPENDTDFLVTHGIPDEACWSYPKEYRMYPLNTTATNWMNRTVKIRNWWYLPENITAIKYALITNGPVPTYFHVFKDFLSYKKGVYRHQWGESFGIHYVCIVGWNDNPGYWIVKNSWGTNYQDEGWFNIAYGECEIEKKSFYLDNVYGTFPIVYVDDDNQFGPWDGSFEHPYKKIQNAVDHVYDGWCVFVKNGLYKEHVVINKSIQIIGENKEKTIIDGENLGQVVTISKPEVIMSGFTIQNSGNLPFDAGIKTLSLHSNATIKDMIFQNNEIGLFLNYAYSSESGVSSWNKITNNIFHDNHQGLYIHWSDHNEIKGNIFYNNMKFGLELHASKFNIIQQNLLLGNSNVGLHLKANSQNNLITKNDFIENKIHAFVDGSFDNKWMRNYWSNSYNLFFKLIRGRLEVLDIPWIEFDIFPSLKRNTDLI